MDEEKDLENLETFMMNGRCTVLEIKFIKKFGSERKATEVLIIT